MMDDAIPRFEPFERRRRGTNGHGFLLLFSNVKVGEAARNKWG
jgi:hypothetical protein